MELGRAMKWSAEPATRGTGTWLVGRCPSQVDVIAAPGTPIPTAPPLARDSQPLEIGWRHVRWQVSQRDLNLDHDLPSGGPWIVDTDRVLATVDVRLHQSVRVILERRLTQLEEIDCLMSMTLDVDEHSCEREVETIRWMRSELQRAFSTASRAPRHPVERVKARYFPAVNTAPLMAVHGKTDEARATAIRIDVDRQPLGGRELARLLKRRLMWRTIKILPPASLVVLRVCSRQQSDMHELLEVHLARQEPKRGRIARLSLPRITPGPLLDEK